MRVYGGEMSAHHYFREFSYCDSGMIPWLLVPSSCASRARRCRELVGDAHRGVPGERRDQPQGAATRRRRSRAGSEITRRTPSVDHTDGLCVDFADWRFNVRASNTEPLVRLNVESRGDEALMREKTDGAARADRRRTRVARDAAQPSDTHCRKRKPSLSLRRSLRPAAYGPGVDDVRLAETHISWVFLTGEYAYKVKKPVKLPFLDFSTLKLRKRFSRGAPRESSLCAGALSRSYRSAARQAPRVGRTRDRVCRENGRVSLRRPARPLAAGALAPGPLRRSASGSRSSTPVCRECAASPVAARSARGGARNVDELQAVAGPDPQALAALRDWTQRTERALIGL